MCHKARFSCGAPRTRRPPVFEAKSNPIGLAALPGQVIPWNVCRVSVKIMRRHSLALFVANYINRVVMGLGAGEDGQTFVEYALILGVVAVTFAALNAAGLGAAIQNSVTQVANALGA